MFGRRCALLFTMLEGMDMLSSQHQGVSEEKGTADVGIRAQWQPTAAGCLPPIESRTSDQHSHCRLSQNLLPQSCRHPHAMPLGKHSGCLLRTKSSPVNDPALPVT